MLLLASVSLLVGSLGSCGIGYVCVRLYKLSQHLCLIKICSKECPPNAHTLLLEGNNDQLHAVTTHLEKYTILSFEYKIECEIELSLYDDEGKNISVFNVRL